MSLTDPTYDNGDSFTDSTESRNTEPVYQYESTVLDQPPADSPVDIQAEIDRRVKEALAAQQAEMEKKIRADVEQKLRSEQDSKKTASQGGQVKNPLYQGGPAYYEPGQFLRGPNHLVLL